MVAATAPPSEQAVDLGRLSAHPLLARASRDDLHDLSELVWAKAWGYASQIPPLSAEQQRLVREAREEDQPEVRLAFERYNRWWSLKWFLFGGLVDIDGLTADPSRAYDPVSNPYLKVRLPGFAVTVDEHDSDTPRKPLPDKRYLRMLAQMWCFEPLLSVPKSRQMMVTWLFCAIACHMLVSQRYANLAVISKKEGHSDKHLERVKEIADALPARFGAPRVDKKIGELSCGETGSGALAMDETAKGLRQFTFSWVFFDEMAFHDNADETLRAALATTKGTGGDKTKQGRITLVSTPNGDEPFYRTVSNNRVIPVPHGR